MEQQNEPLNDKQKLSLLLSSTDNGEVTFLVGLLEAHNIHVVVITDEVGGVTGVLESIYPEYEIYVPEEDLVAARKILDQPVENHKTYEWDVYKRTRKKEGCSLDGF